MHLSLCIRKQRDVPTRFFHVGCAVDHGIMKLNGVSLSPGRALYCREHKLGMQLELRSRLRKRRRGSLGAATANSSVGSSPKSDRESKVLLQEASTTPTKRLKNKRMRP